MRKFAAEQYAQNGINLHSGHVPKRIVKNEDGTLSFTAANKAGEETTIKVDMVLAATGELWVLLFPVCWLCSFVSGGRLGGAEYVEGRE